MFSTVSVNGLSFRRDLPLSTEIFLFYVGRCGGGWVFPFSRIYDCSELKRWVCRERKEALHPEYPSFSLFFQRSPLQLPHIPRFKSQAPDFFLKNIVPSFSRVSLVGAGAFAGWLAPPSLLGQSFPCLPQDTQRALVTHPPRPPIKNFAARDSSA